MMGTSFGWLTPLLFVLSLGIGVTSAEAIPVPLTVDSGQSTVVISVSANAPVIGGISGSDTATVSGTVNADLFDPFGPAPVLSASGASLGLSDIHIDLYDNIFLGSIDVDSSGLMADLFGSSVVGTPNLLPMGFDFDLGGWQLTVDAGTIDVTGSGLAGGALPSNPLQIDASVTPFPFLLPPTTASATITPLGGGFGYLGILIPIAISTQFDVGLTDPADLDLTGQIFLEGFFSVPEPAGLLLIGIGLFALAVRRV